MEEKPELKEVVELKTQNYNLLIERNELRRERDELKRKLEFVKKMAAEDYLELVKVSEELNKYLQREYDEYYN